MNSFNHYAYGAVADWVYQVAAGITPLAPGYQKVKIAPQPDARLEELEAYLQTEAGLVHSKWHKTPAGWCYEVTTPVCAEVYIGTRKYEVEPGSYRYYSPIEVENH